MFMISKGSPTLLFFMFTPLNHHTNYCTQEKWTVHTYSSSTPKMPLSTLFPIPALGYGKLFYHLGFSSTVTTFPRFFGTEIITPSPGFPQRIVQIFIEHITLPFIIISFLCVCHHPPFQIISSLMIGTVSYSFLCLSQYLSYSRHSL